MEWSSVCCLWRNQLSHGALMHTQTVRHFLHGEQRVKVFVFNVIWQLPPTSRSAFHKDRSATGSTSMLKRT